MVAVGEQSGLMYFVKLQRTSEKALTAPEDNEDMLIVWHSGPAHAYLDAIRKIEQSNAVRGIDTNIPPVTNSCSHCVN